MILSGIQLPVPLIPGSRPWLDTYSASQVAAICGLSDHDTPRSIHDKKRGIIPPQEQTDDQARGHAWEPEIRDMVAQQNPKWRIEETSTWAHRQRSWQTADPDGLVYASTDPALVDLLEIKTDANLNKWGDVPPVKYLVQCMWQMDVTGARRVHLAACGPFELFHRRPRMYVVEYNSDEARMLRERVMAFDADLKAGIQPPADHTMESDRLAVRYANTGFTDDPGVEIPDTLAEAYLRPYAEKRRVDADAQSGASQLLEFLGTSRKATYRGETIATRIAGRGDKPPTLRATNGLADKALELLTERAMA